jgi:tRNA (mo5U34)-methyltransferase
LSQTGDLRARVAELDWYHTIDLGSGIVTEGLFDHRGVLHHYGLPERLDGARVLDVGTFDGFFAFELERRGASVVATDLADRDLLDWPAPMKRMSHAKPFTPRRTNFDLAKEVLSSRVEYREISAYDVGTSDLGSFDFVFVGSLLVHLRDPVGALMSLHESTSGAIQIVEPTHRFLDLLPGRRAAARFTGTSTDLTWWIANSACLGGWLESAGFVDVSVGNTFVVPFSRMKGGVRHTVARGKTAKSG